ncbi:MAG: hypothetical protein ACRDHP_14050, partial [Ktedonobacterales bacterium]
MPTILDRLHEIGRFLWQLESMDREDLVAALGEESGNGTPDRLDGVSREAYAANLLAHIKTASAI